RQSCTLSRQRPDYHTHAPAPANTCPLSLHDALPILRRVGHQHLAPLRIAAVEVISAHHQHAGELALGAGGGLQGGRFEAGDLCQDRKSTRLNSSHRTISYAVFCLKKKNELFRTPQSA